jgi:uncharacterized protein YjbJ (UPF0337 family)
MNKDQIKGAVKIVTGKVQSEVGKLTENKEQQIKGLGKQIAGKAELIYGNAKEYIKKANSRL